jgi:hypothetical protein
MLCCLPLFISFETFIRVYTVFMVFGVCLYQIDPLLYLISMASMHLLTIFPK